MTSRRLLGLLFVGLLVIGSALWFAGRQPDRASTVGDPVLPDLKASLNAIKEIRLTRGDGSAVTLKRHANHWEVAQRGYRADSGKIRKLLLDLAALTVRAEKTADPSNYSRIGVEAADSATAKSTAVEALTADRNWKILIGKQDSPRAGFVRVPDQRVSQLAEPLITIDLDPKHWLDRSLLDIPATAILSLTVVPAEGPAYTAARDRTGQADMVLVDLPKHAKLAAPDAANAATAALANLTFDDVQERDAIAKGATSRATYTFFDGRSLTIAGRRDAGQTYVAIVAASDTELTERTKGWEFELPGWKFDQLFKPRAELLAK
ncbi:MAG: DUF4340 domain-containing protein [Steroidobacteraceae bacterium]